MAYPATLKTPKQKPTSSEKAYGLLWLSVSSDPKVNEARRQLRDDMTLEGRKRGIMWASKHVRSLTTQERGVA